MKPLVLALLLGVTATMFATPRADAQAPRAPQGTHFIYLIRHGIYDRDTTKDDIRGNGLNALGHEQARLTGQRLAGLGVKLNSLVSSDLLRAAQTGDDIAKVLAMPISRDSLIRECTPISDRPEYMANRSPSDITNCDATLEAAFAKYFKPSPEGDTRDVLVAHGNAIRWLVSRAIGLPTVSWPHFDIANGSLTVIAVRPDGSCRLVVFSDTSHIPAAKQTWSGKGAGWAVAAK